jgi:hypothetical protein
LGVAAAVGLAVWTIWLQRTEKALTYGTVSRGPLVSVRDDAKGRLKIIFDAKPRKDLGLVVLRVFNSGNVPIEGEDFKRPLTFDLHAPVLGAEVVTTIPPDLPAAVTHDGRQVILQPLLLNQRDTVTLKILLAGPGQRLDASARIVGVPQIRQTDFSSEPYRPPLWLVFLAGCIAGVFGFILTILVLVKLSEWREGRAERKVRTDWVKGPGKRLLDMSDNDLGAILLKASAAAQNEESAELYELCSKEMLLPPPLIWQVTEWMRSNYRPEDSNNVSKFRELIRGFR